MKVALFGRTGFVGSSVATILKQNSVPFIGVSRSQTTTDTIAVDWMDAKSLQTIPSDITSIIICSSRLPQKTYAPADIREFFNSNVLGLLNLLEWAKQRNISRIVYCSTLSMIPKPGKNELIDTQAHYPYKISKAAGEHMLMGFCREHKIDYVVLRIASVYGPGMKPDVVHTMIETARSGGVFTLNNRDTRVDLVHVDDVAAAAVESLTVTTANNVINVTSGAPEKLIDLWELVKKIVGAKDARVEVKSDVPIESVSYSSTVFNSLIKRKPIDLETGMKGLIKTYR